LGLKGSLGIALAIIGLAVVLLSAVFSAPGIIGTLGVITLILGVVLEIWNLLDV